MIKQLCLLLIAPVSSLSVSAKDIYIDGKKGEDKNPGSRSQPLKTIAEAARRVNSDVSKETTTIFLSEGV